MTFRLLDVRTGSVRAFTGSDGRAWRSAIGKESAAGLVHLGREGLAGDTVGNRDVHGGPHQAVLAYASEHYPLWRAEGLEAHPGSFGENFVLAGLLDEQVCIGDVYALGGVQVQVSHPRQPCDTLARRFERQDLIARVWATHRGGWYLRVLQEGPVRAGLELTLLDRPNPGGTVARVLGAYLNAAAAPAEALAMARLPGLTPEWVAKLQAKAGRS